MQSGEVERGEHETGDCSEVAVDVKSCEDEKQEEGEEGRIAINQSEPVSIIRVDPH